MSRPTPETDAAEAKRRAEWLHKHKAHKDWIILSVSEVAVIRDELLILERERDEANKELHKQIVRFDELFAEAEKIRIERDEARERIEKQKLEIVRLNGATNHAGGTPLKIALKERDEAREALEEEKKWHNQTHTELVQTQCKLLDMEMKCDQLQDEIKRLKVILDLIKKDVS
jgi:chromosome segregation ATPase